MPDICPASALVGGCDPFPPPGPEITAEEALERLAMLGVDPDTVTISRATISRANTYCPEGWRVKCSLPKGPESMQRNRPGAYDSGLAPLLRQATARIETMIGRAGT